MTRIIASLFLLVALSGCGNNKDDTDLPVHEGELCTTCHEGIEPIHTPEALGGVAECTFCHGGDATKTTKEGAHVPVPANWAEVRGDGLPTALDGFIKDMAPDQLDQLPKAYVKFINPGDIRVLDETCGVCHASHAATMPNSIMTTNAGHYMPTLFLAGFQDYQAIYGSHNAVDPDCTGEEGTVCSLEPLIPAPLEDIEDAIADGDIRQLERYAYDHYLAKSCNTCHAATYGSNDSPHRYRSAGCTACHVVYNKDGVYEGADKSIPNYPVYPKKHEITSAIPTEQCATCHFQGGRIGLLFRGIREGGVGDPPPNAELWNETAYGHAPGYYILDEDTTNDIDDTPADVHYQLGMHCVDCHVGSDVHGDGRIYTTSKYQVDISCEDCHGTPRQRRVPDAGQVYRTDSGRPLPQLSTGPDGQIILTGKVDGAEHVVDQVADYLDGASSVHKPDDNDWAHSDSLTCDTCHTSYNEYCLGCHVSLDLRLSQTDYQTGHKTAGLVGGKRDDYMLDHTLLGIAPDDRVHSVIPSQQVQMAVKDADGNTVLGQDVDDGEGGTKTLGVFRMTAGSDANIGFSTFFQHTTSKVPRSCDTCHRTNDTPEEWARVKGVYGFGTGEFMLENPDGPPVDALQMLAPDGTQLTEWTHIGTGPVPEARRDRALGVTVPATP
ncbi:MAG: hypothetical protein GWP91_15170 [Rhodobacterales bacterium]|nr:hypothetical protein [Rhodobacterales bacterium]